MDLKQALAEGYRPCWHYAGAAWCAAHPGRPVRSAFLVRREHVPSDSPFGGGTTATYRTPEDLGFSATPAEMGLTGDEYGDS